MLRHLALLAAVLAYVGADEDYTCTANKPCSSGCCGAIQDNGIGYCGLGPTYCAPGNCTSSCDQKSDCDPGWGSEWSSAEKCPLNVCCSEYGHCGTTDLFCGPDDAVNRPSGSGSSASGRTVGYYEAWSTGRACDGVFPEALAAAGYTHINFAFLYIDPATFAVSPMSSGDADLYSRIAALKQTYPGLEVWASVGGWSMTDPDQPTAKTFSQLAASESNQAAFFSSLHSFLSQYGFDGLDIDWEYPVAPERSGAPDDFKNFPSWMANLRSQLTSTGSKYGLSVTLPSSYWYLQNFDIVKLERSVDWFNMMSYDLHGTWDSIDTWIGPQVYAHTNLTEINQALDLLWRNDIDPLKVTLGLGYYGRSFTLADPSCTAPGCEFTAGGDAGPCTATSGILSYDEIMTIVKGGTNTARDGQSNVVVKHDQDAAVMIATWGNQWVSYDDETTFKQKTDHANSLGLGGTMAWAIDLDKSGSAGTALTGNNERASLSQSPYDTVQQCAWTECINPFKLCSGHGAGDGPCVPGCPAGTTEATSSKGKDAQCAGNGEFRLFCCPNDAPTTCSTAHGPKFFCDGKCEDSQIQTGITTDGCVIGQNAICCDRSGSLEAQQQCKWSDCRDDGYCIDDPYRHMISQGHPMQAIGYGLCPGNQFRTLCCTEPPPYSNCTWNRGAFGSVCQGTCSDGQAMVATSDFGCSSGQGVICCDVSENNDAVRQFEEALGNFITDPSCPADEMSFESSSPSGGDEGSDLRRDLSRTTPSNLTQLLLKRDYASYGGLEMSKSVVAAILGNSNLATKQKLSIDKLLGPKNLDVDGYVNLFDEFPEYDPVAIFEQALCEWDSVQQNLNDFHSQSNQVCELSPGSGHSKRDLAHADALEKRVFRAWSDTRTGTVPTASYVNIGRLLDRILNGNTVPFLYSRLLRYNNGGQVEANLEVVFDLRNEPSLQQRPGIDIFAVFHFHTPFLEPDPAVTNPTAADYYPAITYVHVYHGQRVYNPNPQIANTRNEWRVDFGAPNPNAPTAPTRRAPFLRCNTTPQQSYWYPGDNVNTATETNLVALFGAQLRAQGILHPDTYSNWDYARGTWNWRPSRQDWPNSGRLTGAGQGLGAPADMRSSNGWPT